MNGVIAGLGSVLLSFHAQADMYDPATNKLTIPSITVDGITYTDVVADSLSSFFEYY